MSNVIRPKLKRTGEESVAKVLLAAAVLIAVLLFPGRGWAEERRFVTGSRLTAGTDSQLTASVRLADLDGNGDLDVVAANGRHWPAENFVFLNAGQARLSVQRELGIDRTPSYATEPIDVDGDGDVDVAVGNDMASNQIFINDGAGRFTPGETFGDLSSLRSLTVADLDRDGDADLLATCRGRQNHFYLNGGDGHFSPGKAFGSQTDSTIDVAVADWTGDGHLDLILANRDDQKNAILVNDGHLNFETKISFGTAREQSRAVAVADMNGDGHLDLVVANIGSQNRVYFGDGVGGIHRSVGFGLADGNTYSLTIADMDHDDDADLIVGNVGQANAVYMNDGRGTSFSAVSFGDKDSATYGLDVGDLNRDGFADIVVANSGGVNAVFLNRPAKFVRVAPNPAVKKAVAISDENQSDSVSDVTDSDVTDRKTGWGSFRGDGAKGVADGYPVRSEWNADSTSGDVDGVLWSIRVPGLGHSSPVIYGNRLFLASAVAADGAAPLQVGRGGQPDAAEDNGVQDWVVLCYDRRTGKELWRRTASHGIPRATRHAKATHANTSVSVDGENVVAFFGSEGIHCFDLDGTLKWSRDLGVINISKYGIGWGFASSPAIHGNRIGIVCDDPDKPFVACLRLSDGEELWRASRDDICERSWGTPLIHSSPDRTQMVVNGWPWIVSYDFETGEPLWRIRGGGDNPVPTPFEAKGAIYVTNAHGAESPIFVVRPDASGDVTPEEETGTNDSIVWSVRRGGCYMSTPVVYGDYLYLGNTNGVVRCFHAESGEKVYEKRLGSGASIIASLVAADGKVYCASENGIVYVLKAGPKLEILSKNQMGAPCFATPAISRGVLYIRTTQDLIAIQ